MGVLRVRCSWPGNYSSDYNKGFCMERSVRRVHPLQNDIIHKFYLCLFKTCMHCYTCTHIYSRRTSTRKRHTRHTHTIRARTHVRYTHTHTHTHTRALPPTRPTCKPSRPSVYLSIRHSCSPPTHPPSHLHK